MIVTVETEEFNNLEQFDVVSELCPLCGHILEVASVTYLIAICLSCGEEFDIRELTHE